MLENYPVKIHLETMWGEMDSFQHINNIIYFRYFESVRIDYFIKIRALEIMEKTKVGPILAETQCKFKRPLKFPEKIVVGGKIDEIWEDRFQMKYAVWSEGQDKRPAAEGSGLIVYYDYQNNKRASLPDEILSNIKKIENMEAK
tara:strand:- start:2 stop:433 length:432 start_codon:yes stop_codon:yes gene_type:complete